MTKKGKILIIDDNEDILFALNTLLLPYLEKIKVSTNPEKIDSFMDSYQPDIILLDMNFRKDMVSGKEGFFWLDRILKINPKAIVILMTAYADTEKAVQAIKAGATDFISKPWEKEKLLATLFSALKLKESQNELETVKAQLRTVNNPDIQNEIIGESEVMQNVFSLIKRLADTEANILLLGENGTGKDLIAHAIYQHSIRSQQVFVNIDLGTVPESLFESELFGYEKGAFTDAKKEKAGRMEVASGGTLFLNEIGNLSSTVQAKLLTAIEKKEISRLGSTRSIPIDVRFISATNTDLYTEVENNNFRQDLLYRINTIEINLPPLRERGNDMILLANHFLEKFCHKYKRSIDSLSRDAKEKILAYSWPGNVRELQNVIERAVILSSGQTLKGSHIILQTTERRKTQNNEVLNLEKLEKEAIDKALIRTNGNMNKASELLGITRYALYRKIKKE
ncbi:sigma-54 dependent transcriptional regulator [Bacteroidales bacterium OttesenSCG-928-M11]|nr:sigma-54 dependent transcriptional regulator [Bacteroidales bacterium OttesenSCG-928-M11]